VEGMTSVCWRRWRRKGSFGENSMTRFKWPGHPVVAVVMSPFLTPDPVHLPPFPNYILSLLLRDSKSWSLSTYSPNNLALRRAHYCK
jgi:hypothetical protein